MIHPDKLRFQGKGKAKVGCLISRGFHAGMGIILKEVHDETEKQLRYRGILKCRTTL